MSSSAATNGTTEEEPGPKRRKLLDAGGPIEDDETARQKMRDAQVREIGTYREFSGFDPDNVRDVKRFFLNESTAMGYFAMVKGDLPMMRWLYVNGADTRDVDVDYWFPMHMVAASLHGETEVCKWLFDHGAAKDIKRRTREKNTTVYPKGRSPLSVAFTNVEAPSHRKLSQWLILNGALCKDDDSGDLDVETAWQDLGEAYAWRGVQERKALLEWANDLHRPRTSFLLFLSGALCAPKHAYRTRRNSSPAKVLSGKSGVMELIGNYVGFIRGREARIIRQLTELLPNLIQQLD